jgi:hypothetical protein
MATAKLVEYGIGCLIAAWPALIVTKCVTVAERRALLGMFLPGQRAAMAVPE